MLRLPARRPARRPARPAALVLALGLLVPTLAACGDDEGGSGAADGGTEGLAAVEVAGDFGAAPEVTFEDRMTVEETESEVLVEGEGETIEDGEAALVHFYIGNGFTQEEAVSSYEADQPQLVALGDGVIPGIREALEGRAVGTRVAVAASPADAFGEQGNPQLSIGNGDSVLFVVDILSQVLEEPQGEQVEPEGPVPTLQETDGTISSLAFPKGYEGTGELEVTTLVEGDGEPVTADSVVAVDYLGQVLGKKKPFDESYSTAPRAFPLDGVVEGWTQGLDGVPVGSRVVLRIPPELGYGKQGNPQAGIKGTDTLVFVIDVLGAS